MIKYNNNTINDWNFGDDNIIKVYKHGAVCYYKITSGDTPTPVQEPCFAVVDNISQYTDTEFEDVFNKADGKWYKLNNLTQYEEYGVYGSGRTITYYDGKLTVDGDYEYQYSGGSWVNVGEVSGGTATLPDVPFTLNYNAKNYDASTHTIPYTEGALNAIDAVITGTTANIIDHHEDGYIELTGSKSTTIRALVGTTNFSRSSSNPNITIVCKAYTPGSSTEGNILSNRKESYNWMYRHKSSILTFHGTSEQGSIAVSNTEPNTCSVRIDSSRLLTYNNWTQNTTSTYSNFNYGSNSNGGALFSGYYSTSSEMWKGVFYWIYMSLNTLTDEQVQQVIAYNEEGGGEPEYPKYYDEIQDPPDNLVFSSMAEAEAYECPWVGMKATIDGDKYIFSGDSQSGYEWVFNPSRVPQGYTELQYCTVPKVSNTAQSFMIKSKNNVAYDYTISFMPIGWETNSYYKFLIGGSENYPPASMFSVFSLDNGWSGGRWIVNGLGYVMDSRNSEFQNKTSFHDNVNASITMCYNERQQNNGIKVTIENEGYTTYTGVSTTVKTGSGTKVDYNTEYDIPLFTMYNNASYYTPNMRFYNFKVYNTVNETDVYHYVPVKRDSDDKVGICDIVSQNVYFPPTHIVLTAGPEI